MAGNQCVANGMNAKIMESAMKEKVLPDKKKKKKFNPFK